MVCGLKKDRTQSEVAFKHHLLAGRYDHHRDNQTALERVLKKNGTLFGLAFTQCLLAGRHEHHRNNKTTLVSRH